MPNPIIRLRPASLLPRIFLLVTCFYVAYYLNAIFDPAISYLCSISRAEKQLPHRSPPNPLFLTREQCSATFPGYAKQIEEATAKGGFKLERKKDAEFSGPNYGRIKDGKLYIISVAKEVSEVMLQDRTASFHQIHRAILTSPEPIPDTIFALNVLDYPQARTWSYSRPVSDREGRGPTFPMPHFSYFSWPKKNIGSLSGIISRITAVEESMSWSEKIDKAVWRGTAWLSPAGRPEERRKLVQIAREKGVGKEKGQMKPWADIESLDGGKGNELKIEDFCRYRYVLYTEGVTYSGRLPFHQACNSVLLSTPINYLQHTSHLIRPLFSWALPLSSSSAVQELPSKPLPNLDPKSNTTFPVSYPPNEANAVLVSRNWEDLEETMQYLQAHPAIGETIARNQREMFVEKGYLSDAAEACYWRELIHAWNNFVEIDEEEWEEGMLWEDYILTGKLRWD